MSASSSRDHAPRSPLQRVVSGLILTLFLVRFFDVTESTAQGDTLWIVALWFFALLIWTISSWNSTTSFAISMNWLDVGVILLVGGHIVSALVVLIFGGEKRSAVNLAWEWTGLLVGWYLLRFECRRPVFRRELLVALIAVGTTLAGLGLYQHYIGFPRMAAKYGPLFDQLKEANPFQAASIRQQLAKDHIPIEGPGLTQFEKRLRDSREPLGVFALANTFGGFLAVCFILSIGLFMTTFRADSNRRDWRQQFGFRVPITILLSWCLLLTKSRTACIGAGTGLAIWVLRQRRFKITPRHWLGCAGALFVLTLAIWGISRMGGLDRQVITEALKSLQYRLQYWSATWQMIKRHPWFGVGPGQFRSYYLIHRLPAASEEISDPHNLFFDVAANGGITAFLGLVILCVGLFRSTESPGEGDEFSVLSATPQIERLTMTGLAAVAWCFLVTGYDDRLLILVPLAVVLFWGFDRSLGRKFDIPFRIRRCAFPAAVTLLVHLCGAGGIGMPAVSLLWLVLIAMADGRPASFTAANGFPRSQRLLTASLSIAALTALFLTALRPVVSAQLHMDKANLLIQDKRDYRQAAAEYRLAAAADHLNPEPWRQQAVLAFREAQANRFQSNELFQTAVHLMHEAGLRDPVNFHDEEALGDWWLARWEATNDPKDAQEAATAKERAWRLCPTNAMLMAGLAIARDANGDTDPAHEMAVKALKQDDLNHQNQHVDRYLPDSVRNKMEMLASM